MAHNIIVVTQHDVISDSRTTIRKAYPTQVTAIQAVIDGGGRSVVLAGVAALGSPFALPRRRSRTSGAGRIAEVVRIRWIERTHGHDNN